MTTTPQELRNYPPYPEPSVAFTLEALAAKLDAWRVSIYHTAENPDLAFYGAWRAHIPKYGTLYGESWLAVAHQVWQLELIDDSVELADPWQLQVTLMQRDIDHATKLCEPFYSDSVALPAVPDTELKRILGDVLYRELVAYQSEGAQNRVLLRDGRLAWIQGPVKEWLNRIATAKN